MSMILKHLFIRAIQCYGIPLCHQSHCRIILPLSDLGFRIATHNGCPVIPNDKKGRKLKHQVSWNEIQETRIVWKTPTPSILELEAQVTRIVDNWAIGTTIIIECHVFHFLIFVSNSHRLFCNLNLCSHPKLCCFVYFSLISLIIIENICCFETEKKFLFILY